MKRVLNKWQLVWQFGKELEYDRWGWRLAVIGVVKLKNFPPENQRFGKANYIGVILTWRYWLPWEKVA